jgi:hypothetical protein
VRRHGFLPHEPQGNLDFFSRREPRPYGFHQDQLLGDNDVFGRREPRPYGFGSHDLYGDDNIFRGREPRHYIFNQDQLHDDDNIFGGLDPWRDRLHHHHRGTEWDSDALGGFGDNGLFPIPAIRPGGGGGGLLPALATPFDSFGEGPGMELVFGSQRY